MAYSHLNRKQLCFESFVFKSPDFIDQIEFYSPNFINQLEFNSPDFIKHDFISRMTTE
jgi:hypothetical protein